MAAYLKIAGIEGEATEQGHDKWINLETVTAPISRSIPEGAVDQARARGTTTLSDIQVTRPVDKSSVKLSESCAQGQFIDEAEIHLSTQVKGKEEPYLKYKLKNVIITSYCLSGNASGSPQPSEVFTLNFTDIEWTYVVIDPKTGDKKGNVPGKFSLGQKQA